MRMRKQIEDLRCPATKGLPEDAVRLLHHSLVDIVRMRRSIETTDRQLKLSHEAIFETCELLSRLRWLGL